MESTSYYVLSFRIVFKKTLNASKPSEHPPSGEKMSKGLGGNIGSRDKTFLPCEHGLIQLIM